MTNADARMTRIEAAVLLSSFVMTNAISLLADARAGAIDGSRPLIF
jgi:hypothetical protein